ncbi:MAG: hypothetical protein ACE5J2_08920 [Nitrososphaerales archaeon]
MNKLTFGIIVTTIPLGAGIAWGMGIFGASGGILSPDIRPDHQTPALTTMKLTIENVDGVDRLVTSAGKVNPTLTSSPFYILRLEITNNGNGTHDIMVLETGVSTGSIDPGMTRSVDITYDSVGDLSYQSGNDPDAISGKILIRSTT